ncbi:bifunctional DNA-formamidopyrimidine glycosylase/DNA-(apurinic or apyrimidinic site) lyase [Luteithermobacter gelatinilyticus]|uniref:bifunctional DNA-formamidopyrimidine glycosylase/DNA-(apurinic or apyrimidinic site) lyase n=1 Tax=Luteithermobacter gelatinilyticus TaxID=2582913 RepID=UPI001106B27E|nr:bifunctional DNA-formamidopyrimidine glycosylase/DNA-(apurinic or apyrimidinic site) lyase [Luteithermobacter gelatinilyticus]
MPELPEVETVRRGLIPVLEGCRIARVVKRRDDLRGHLPENFVGRLEGRRVDHIHRRAKYLLFRLDNSEVLILHLGMSGRLTLVAAAERTAGLGQGKHDHVLFETSRGDLVIFTDPRRFGLMDLCREEDLAAHRLFRHLGPEPLGNDFNGAYLSARLRGRKTSIKSALLDQRIVAGLGNIYVCEALYDAGISPRRRAASVAGRRAERLVPAIREVLHRAIAAGGSSLKDYARVDGELGYFQHDFGVYGRTGEPCRKTACSGRISRFVQAGRSTFYCPACQG